MYTVTKNTKLISLVLMLIGVIALGYGFMQGAGHHTDEEIVRSSKPRGDGFFFFRTNYEKGLLTVRYPPNENSKNPFIGSLIEKLYKVLKHNYFCIK